MRQFFEPREEINYPFSEQIAKLVQQIHSMYLKTLSEGELVCVFGSTKTKFSLNFYILNTFFLNQINWAIVPHLHSFFSELIDLKRFPNCFKIERVLALCKV